MVITFLYALSGGMLVILSATRVEQIAWNFLRLVGFLSFAMICFDTLWSLVRGVDHGLASDWAIRLGLVTAFAAVVLVFIAGLADRRPGLIRVICGVGGLTGIAAAAAMIAQALSGAGASTPVIVLAVCGQILGALLLGSITLAWLLGHAYLTATRMTIAPLRHLSRLLLWSVTLRLVFLIAVLGFPFLLGEVAGLPSKQAIMGSWLLLILRVGVGLILVGVFAYMVADCVRLRATQSATGILYFASIPAYVGELAAHHLTLYLTWPM
jgi:hypothetical protein